MKVLTRKELNRKYMNYHTFEIFKNETKDNYIKFYKSNIELLKTLIDELCELKNVTKTDSKQLNYRQRGCIKRCYRDDKGWEKENDKFRQKIIEICDFIFYSDDLEYCDEYLTKYEIELLLEMSEFCFNLASVRLKCWEYEE